MTCLRGDPQSDAVCIMVLMHQHSINARRGQRLYPHLAVNAERRQRDVPVPAVVALRFAQQVHVGDWVVALLIRQIERLFRLQFGGMCDGVLEGQADRVRTDFGSVTQRHAESAESVVAGEDMHAVHAHFDNRIDARQDTFHIGPVQRDLARCGPVPLGDPAQVIFVPPPIGIGDQIGLLKRRDRIARKLDRARKMAALVRKRPCSRKVLWCHRRSSVDLSKSEAFDGSIPIAIVSPARTLA